MTKTCSTCGADFQAGARFCRRCGTPQRVGDDAPDGVSPQAATVPLSDEMGRTTDGLADDDPRRTAADTTRVNRSDLERLLRPPAPAPDNGRSADLEATFLQPERAAPDGNSTRGQHVPDTGELSPPVAAASDDFGMMTRPVFNDEPDEELTITVPRAARPFDGSQSPSPVELTPAQGATPQELHTPTAGVTAQPPPAPPVAIAARAPRRAWPYVLAAACVLLLGVAGVVGWLAATRWRSPAPTEVSSVPPVAPPDAKQLFEQKMSEAESLLAAGDTNAAIARLREASGLDPANTRAHQRLGEIFLDQGQRREAIEEFRAVTQNNPDDFAAWRALASAQLAEGVYDDAAESYRRLVAVVGDAAADPNDLLSYADALRQSGRTDEARAVYQRLTSASAADVAALARQRLNDMAQPAPTTTPKPNETASERAAREREQNPSALANTSATPQPTVQPTPTPAPTPPPVVRAELTPAEHYQRGVELWSGNRAAAVREFASASQSGNPDAYYYLGLHLVEGKDMGSLKRAEIVAALRYFQLAGRGQFGAQSRRYAQQLEKEFDRLRNQR